MRILVPIIFLCFIFPIQLYMNIQEIKLLNIYTETSDIIMIVTLHIFEFLSLFYFSKNKKFVNGYLFLATTITIFSLSASYIYKELNGEKECVIAFAVLTILHFIKIFVEYVLIDNFTNKKLAKENDV